MLLTHMHGSCRTVRLVSSSTQSKMKDKVTGCLFVCFLECFSEVENDTLLWSGRPGDGTCRVYPQAILIMGGFGAACNDATNEHAYTDAYHS